MIFTRQGKLRTAITLAFATAARVSVAFAEPEGQKISPEDLAATRSVWQRGLDATKQAVLDMSHQLRDCQDDAQCIALLAECKKELGILQGAGRVQQAGEDIYQSMGAVGKFLMTQDMKFMHASGAASQQATNKAIASIRSETGAPCVWPKAQP